jgi:hypothetical protein
MDAAELRRLELTAGCDEEVAAEPTGWATEDHYRLLSVPLLVRTMHPGFAEALRWHLAPFRREEPGVALGEVVDMWEREDAGEGFLDEGLDAPRFVYFRDGQTRVASLTGLLSFAIWDLHAMVTQAPDFLFLHAGSVARNGGAVLLLAPMDVGKSTLTTALLLEGFAYLSDELGAIDPVTTRAYPFPKRISLDPEALMHFPGLEERLDDRELSAGLRQRYIRPEDLGASVAAPSPIRSIVFLASDRSGPARLKEITRAESVQRMVPHCFNLDRHRERGMVLLSRLASGATTRVLEGGTPRERAALLADQLP